jgi:carbonic anhydrase
MIDSPARPPGSMAPGRAGQRFKGEPTMKCNEVSRRTVFRHACCAIALTSPWGWAPSVAAEGQKTTLTPEQALAKLKKGNADFLADKPSISPQDSDRRLAIARAQIPFAVLVGCSDSRVSPELLFDTGLGELFIVRNAGNTVGTVALGSIQYGVQVLGAPLVVVLGHERCGAVEAAMAVVEKNATYPGSIGDMVEPIIPAALKAKANAGLQGADLLDAAVHENVRRIVERLRTAEPALADPLRAGKLKVVGAHYDLDDGRVDFFIE